MTDTVIPFDQAWEAKKALAVREADGEPPPGLFDDVPDPTLKDHPLAGVAHVECVRLTPSERALKLGQIIVRQACGLKTLDLAMRGGLPARRRVFFVGGAGCFKSATVITLSVKLMLAGWHVAIIAADECADDVLIRIGRTLGFDRDALEDGNHPYHLETKRKLSELLARYKLTLVDDGDDPDPSIEAVARDLADRANGEPSCLTVDSIQTAQCISSAEADSPRAATDAKIKALKYASDVCGHLVLATSEANRSWTAASADNRSAPIGAAKESSAIEYAAHAQIVMAPVKGEPDLVDCVVAKNRMGKRDIKFRIEWDAGPHTIAEVDGDDEAADAPSLRRPQRPDKRAATMALAVKVEEFIRTNPGTSGRRICSQVTGTDTRILAALEELVSMGRIAPTPGPNGGTAWKVTDSEVASA
jgi:KaiC/GvpD/RAD55 family RecA-like ATPase